VVRNDHPAATSGHPFYETWPRTNVSISRVSRDDPVAPLCGQLVPRHADRMLLGIAIVLVAASLAGALLLVARAPAVSLALIGGMAGGLCGFYFGSHHGPKGVPADVAVGATCGLVALGLIGLLVTPRGPARLLRRAAVGVVLTAPLAAASLAVALLYACPLYVTDHAGFCFHEFDVLGGWISGVVVLFVLDAAALTVLLLVSAKEVRDT
jgi:hypothetical protein